MIVVLSEVAWWMLGTVRCLPKHNTLSYEVFF